MWRNPDALPEDLDQTDLKTKLKKAVSLLFGLFTLLLIGGGFAIMAYLGIQVYKNPGNPVGDLARTFSAPSQSSKLAETEPRPSPIPTASSKFVGSALGDAKNVFTDPKYQNIIEILNSAQKETDSKVKYKDYVTVFNLMKSAFNTTHEPDIIQVMMNVQIEASTMPEYKSADMIFPSS